MDNLKPFHMMHPHDANEPLHSCLAAPHRWPGAQACCRRCCCAEASALYLTRPPQVIVPATLYLPPTDPLRSLCRRLSTCRRLTPSGHCAGNSRPGRARVLRAPAAALHTTPGRETSALPGGEEQVAARPIPPVVPRPPACHRPPPNARARRRRPWRSCPRASACAAGPAGASSNYSSGTGSTSPAARR